MTKRARIMEATMKTMTTTETDVSDGEIDQLRIEAAAAGDEEQVQLCDLALAGDASARAECMRVIMEGLASIWVTVQRIPQIDGGVRLVQVPASYSAEVRRVLRADPTRVDGLWCPVRLVGGGRRSRRL